LVLYPELALGYFGGDPDNFTYPRFNLDFTFFRAYDESGNPLKASNYYEFNAKGAADGEVVFVVGNPGSTGRYKTMAELYYDRDIQVPAVLTFLKDRFEILMAEADREKDVYVKDSITNLAFSLSNGLKAYSGRLDGLNDEILMARKLKREQMVRGASKVEASDPWIKIEDNVSQASNYFAESIFLSSSPYNGKIMGLLHKLSTYPDLIGSENQEEIEAAKTDIRNSLTDLNPDLEKLIFATVMDEWAAHTKQGEALTFLEGKAGVQKAEQIMSKSLLFTDADKFFELKESKLEKDPVMVASKSLTGQYQIASKKVRALIADNKQYAGKIMNLQFQLSGISSPPDATFSLRWSDGVVKGYDYNGTQAPYKTTYFGLYDRYYSNDGKSPWNLPDRWQNPPLELLQQPLNFVCTADIIGGNSGSALVNTKGEAIGLAFDGNMESLPGYFIYEDTFNRTVSVHSGGIAGALKYIYKAERLMKELNIE